MLHSLYQFALTFIMFHISYAYKAEAEAVEMCKDVALTAWIAVLEPGATQHPLLLQDSEAISWKRGKISMD